jgi:hypothetical protein
VRRAEGLVKESLLNCEKLSNKLLSAQLLWTNHFDISAKNADYEDY